MRPGSSRLPHALLSAMVQDSVAPVQEQDDENYEPAGYLKLAGPEPRGVPGQPVVACIRCAALIGDTFASRKLHDRFHVELQVTEARSLST